jgi:hypothetical protein
MVSSYVSVREVGVMEYSFFLESSQMKIRTNMFITIYVAYVMLITCIIYKRNIRTSVLPRDSKNRQNGKTEIIKIHFVDTSPQGRSDVGIHHKPTLSLEDRKET